MHIAVRRRRLLSTSVSIEVAGASAEGVIGGSISRPPEAAGGF
jgi:hypothetical protein